METSCSPIEETAMDIAVAPSRTKSKTALNRRPSGYWKVFSNWWRGRYAALKTRPTVNEVIEWYHRNAASSWPSGQVPCLKAVLRQSKGLRPIDGLKEYFREYRKKRKQQGGLALKAGDDAAHRRARPAKRRRGRAAHKDSSDEEDVDELEQEASMCSDQHSSDDEEEEVEVPAPRRQRANGHGRCTATASASDGGDEDVEVGEAVPDTMSPFAAAANAECGDGACRNLGPVHAVYDTWHEPAAAAAVPLAEYPAGPLCPSSLVAADLACVGPVVDGSEAAMLQAAAGDPVHPAVAQGMVPISSGGSPRVSGPPAGMYPPCSGAAPPSPFVYIPRVAARRFPATTKAAAMRRSGSRLSLPPLAGSGAGMLTARGLPRMASAAAALDAGRTSRAIKPEAVSKAEPGADDHAGDRCSTGGGVPPVPCDARLPRVCMHERAYDVPYGFDYVPYGPSAPFGCHPPAHPSYRSVPYPVGYSYRAMSSASYPPVPDCSNGGGTSSNLSPSAPWPVASVNDGSASYAVHRQGSVESKSHLDGCFPHHPLHHHPHAQAWFPWTPTDGGAPWQSGPPPSLLPYVHDATAWGRGTARLGGAMAMCGYGPVPGGAASMGCPCGSCPDSMHFGSGAYPSGMRSMYGYYPRHCMAGYAGAFPEMWAGMAARPHGPEATTAERETCSSSVSEQEGMEHGHWSPCSGASGQQPLKPCTSQTMAAYWPHQHRFAMAHGNSMHGRVMAGLGCYAMGMYALARGLANAGSVTSMTTLAAMDEEAPYMPGVAACRIGRGSVLASGPGSGVVHRGDEAAAAPAACCDADVYLADAPSSVVPAASSEGAAQAETDRLEGSPLQTAAASCAAGLEGADCGLGLADGFGAAARDTLDHDLDFAFADFVSCEAGSGFEAALT